MLRVALTGGIATGKSYVLGLFRTRGVPCLDADMLARGVIAPGTEATKAIADRFGADTINEDGAVNRPKLAAIVFSDDVARRDLEAIVHPAVYRAIHAGLRAFELVGNYPLGMVDIPLLYESGHAGEFDKVILTACPEGLQLARLKERGMSETDAKQRIAAQWPTARKAERADFVVNTARTVEDTDRQVDEIYRALTTNHEVTKTRKKA
jgi:dephospho-CoA kinase